MEKEILVNVEPLIEATRQNKISWKYIDNTNCVTVYFNRNKLIMCRYTFKKNMETAIAFNYINEEIKSADDEFNQWHQTDPEFQRLNLLYDLAVEHSTQLKIA